MYKNERSKLNNVQNCTTLAYNNKEADNNANNANRRPGVAGGVLVRVDTSWHIVLRIRFLNPTFLNTATSLRPQLRCDCFVNKTYKAQAGGL